MARIALSFALASIVSASLFLAGCGAQPGDESDGNSDGALNGAPCDPSDKTCVPPGSDGVCDPSDPTDADCPCDPSDTSCKPPCDPSDTNCTKLPPNVDCASLAQTLAQILAQAQACNLASAGAKAQCAAFVPTTSGCSAPVADAGSEATLKYEQIFKFEYLPSCPLPVPACPDPSTLKTGCVQGPDVDSLVGACAVLTDATTAAGAQ
jgi:hypothetical protein